MVTLNNVTLVCATSINIERAIKALNYSKEGIDFYNVILLTDKNVNPIGINIININPLDYIGYSKFIIYDLYKHVNTDYVLIIQDDGFVVNPDKWDPEFLKYDYIGAPFRIPPVNDKITYRTPFGKLTRVGNGGFSLRSKKLLSLAPKLNLPWKPYFGYWNEDGFFTCHNRHLYEENGCVYAPVDVASRFSHEYQTSETRNIIPFGFHGKNHPYYNLI